MQDFFTYLYAGFWFLTSMLTTAPHTDITVFELTPTTAGVEEFLEQRDIPVAAWDGDCFSVLPAALSDESGLKLYKFDGACASVLDCEGVFYYLGINYGGFGLMISEPRSGCAGRRAGVRPPAADNHGLTNGALADMNGDGALEIYYAFSFGSGIHRGMVASFDTATKQETLYDISFWNGDLYLRANGSTLEICEALLLNTDSYVKIRAIPGKTLATLSCINGEIAFTTLAESYRSVPTNPAADMSGTSSGI